MEGEDEKEEKGEDEEEGGWVPLKSLRPHRCKITRGASVNAKATPARSRVYADNLRINTTLKRRARRQACVPRALGTRKGSTVGVCPVLSAFIFNHNSHIAGSKSEMISSNILNEYWSPQELNWGAHCLGWPVTHLCTTASSQDKRKKKKEKQLSEVHSHEGKQ